ncbi:PAS domain-containing protein [uncultured Parasphingorhabdus sp.]|uniref:PAS domain-containing protein n=1 Tax=uncultured Parasphingorhabdus sp. TaxID=2709694 RepID=UPI0030DD453C
MLTLLKKYCSTKLMVVTMGNNPVEMRGCGRSMLSVYLSYSLALALCVVIVILVFGLRKTKADLRSVGVELERCQLTLEISEDVGRFGSWHMNAATNVVRWSDYIFDMHERRQSLGNPMLENAISYYHPNDRHMVESAVQLALEEGEDFEFRARIITEQGNELPVLARGTCQIGGDGKVLGIFGCFVDLSTPEDRKSS